MFYRLCYERGTRALQKMCDTIGGGGGGGEVAAQLSLPFPGGKWVAWTK